MNGSGGIPLKGREKEYATELWLESPSAFWLHPEGPLSETTPDEWREKERERKQAVPTPDYQALRGQMQMQRLTIEAQYANYAASLLNAKSGGIIPAPNGLLNYQNSTQGMATNSLIGALFR